LVKLELASLDFAVLRDGWDLVVDVTTEADETYSLTIPA
jgi:hypothetical protein